MVKFSNTSWIFTEKPSISRWCNSCIFCGSSGTQWCNPNSALLNIPSACRHQGAAFDHECHMRLRPQQSHQLHGTRPDGGLPAGQVQCRLGRQAPVDPALLHALLRGWYWTPAGFAPPLKECVASLGLCCHALNVYQLPLYLSYAVRAAVLSLPG